MVLSHPVCLERAVTYTLRFEFTRYQDANSVLNGAASAVLLVDSVRSIYFCQSFLTNGPFLTNASLSFALFESDFLDAATHLHGDVHRRGSSLQQQEAELRALPLPRGRKECEPPADEQHVQQGHQQHVSCHPRRGSA